MHPTKALINLGTLKRNYANIRQYAGGLKMMAVVKADAYGHGAIETTNALLFSEYPPEYLAVAFLSEAIELRNKFNDINILVFDSFSIKHFECYIKNDLIATLNSWEQIEELKKLNSKHILKVHVKIDTGMHRLGIDFKEAEALFVALASIKTVRVDGVYTHLACSEETVQKYSQLQIHRFKSVLEALNKRGLDYGLRHCANSGAILNLPDSYFDIARPGIMLYGYYTLQKAKHLIDIKPVMSLVSTISSIIRIKAMQPLGYNRNYYLSNDSYVFTLPAGYADGISRALTNKIKCLCKGKEYSGAGTISMDRMIFEAGDDKLQIGEEVVLLGKSGELEINAWDWANLLNTIPYEITCSISKRVPRIYVE